MYELYQYNDKTTVMKYINVFHTIEDAKAYANKKTKYLAWTTELTAFDKITSILFVIKGKAVFGEDIKYMIIPRKNDDVTELSELN